MLPIAHPNAFAQNAFAQAQEAVLREKKKQRRPGKLFNGN
jgi:hypothetical protein